jgi:hypothetical protein
VQAPTPDRMVRASTSLADPSGRPDLVAHRDASRTWVALPRVETAVSLHTGN